MRTPQAPPALPDFDSLIPDPPPDTLIYWDDDGVFLFCPDNGELFYFVSIRHADERYRIRAWVKGERVTLANMPAETPDFKAVYTELMVMHRDLRGIGYLSGRGRWEVLCG